MIGWNANFFSKLDIFVCMYHILEEREKEKDYISQETKFEGEIIQKLMREKRGKSLSNLSASCPTNPFTISEPQDQEIVEFYVVQERRATDFVAPKL